MIALEPFGSCKRVISCPLACTGTNIPDSAFAAVNPSIARNEYDESHSNGTSIPPMITSSLPTLNIFKYVFKFPFAFILKSDAVSEFSCGSLRILRSGKEYNAHITHKGESIMRDRIISNVLIKMGSRIKKKELQFLENVLVEEFQDVQVKKECTDVAKYNDSLGKLKDMFLATLIVENKSNRTIEQYNLHLTQFVNYFTGKDAKDIDATGIRSFLYAYKKNRGISNLSLNNKRSAISSFFSWLVDEEYIDKDPTRKIKKIKVTKKKKKAFTADEMERMRIACTDIRDRALIEMLACTGCRVSELSNISLNDVDFLRKKVRIVGKGDKERTVFISDTAMIYLNRYLETRQDNNIALFVSKRFPYDRLRKDGIERVVRDLGRMCNVYAHPHKFRRTLCTNLIMRGMPLQNVAILMGHADINMTANVYYDASDRAIEYEYIRYAA